MKFSKTLFHKLKIYILNMSEFVLYVVIPLWKAEAS